MTKKKVVVLALLLALFLSACANQNRSTDNSAQQLAKAYVGSTSSDKYHRPSCEWAKKIKPDNAVWFSSPEEAKKTGYKPCKVCRPPG